MVKEAREYLHSFINKNKIEDSKRFFKTNEGEYGYKDEFLGIKVPDTRKAVKKYYKLLTLDEIKEFLYSIYHEERLFAILVLVSMYKNNKDEIYNFYIENRSQINNWDLVDVSCVHIIGDYLLDKDRNILYEFANSSNLWEKRLAIISTFAFIKQNDFKDTLKIADILLYDTHDLIHKAVGWAIRNVGIKDFHTQIEFLKPRYKTMPRTMLRYAIEKFDEELRQKFLKSNI